MIMRLHHNPQLQYKYVKTVIEHMKDHIMKTVTEYQNAKSSAEAVTWKKILLLHVELACKVEPTKFESIFKEILKDKFYPYEECLKICKQYGQNEAVALLAKKIGDYMTSIEIYFKVLADHLKIKPFRKELYYMYSQLEVPRQNTKK